MSIRPENIGETMNINAFVLAMILIGSITIGASIMKIGYWMDEQHTAAIQNATDYGVSLCTNATYAQISNTLIQQGYIPWTMAYQNQTLQMRLVPVNVSEVKP